MRIPVAHRALTAWIALVAILMATFAPAISQTLAAQHAGDWAEICSAHGVDRIALDPDQTPAPTTADAHGACDYCTPHVQAGGVTPVAPATGPFAIRVPHAPIAFLSAPYTPFAWRSAPSRAPPTPA